VGCDEETDRNARQEPDPKQTIEVIGEFVVDQILYEAP